MKLILQAIKSMFRGVYNAIEASKTHWDTRKTLSAEYTFDGNLEGKEIVAPEDGFCLVKVADDFPEISSITDLKVTYSSPSGSWDDETENGSPADCVFEVADGVYCVFYQDVMYVSKDTEFEGIGLAKGLYFFYTTTDDFYVSKLSVTYSVGELKKLDKKYLPDNIATVEQVEAVQTTAENAQTTAENITKTVKIPNAADSAAGISAYSQCLNAYNRGDNLIYVRNNQEYEFNEYKSNCFYFRRYDPDALSFTYLTVKTTSVFSSTTYIQKMRGATASAYGLEGLVPAPSTGQHNMVLYGDATWRDPMIVCSSTEGSTKKFKIAVDDTGAITATEVT